MAQDFLVASTQIIRAQAGFFLVRMIHCRLSAPISQVERDGGHLRQALHKREILTTRSEVRGLAVGRSTSGNRN
jgi:hypothetical protein